MFNRKVKTVGTISEFMNKKQEVLHESEIEAYNTLKGLANLTWVPIVIAPFTKVQQASAHGPEAVTVAATAGSGEIYEKMMTAFEPLIDLTQALAYPIAMVVVLGGCLFLMVGQREKGLSMMSSAGLGVVLVNVAPMILQILIDAMKAVI
jgi:hypothetical protein